MVGFTRKNQASAGDEINFTINYNNQTGADILQFKLEDPIDTTLVDFISAPGGGSLVGSKVTWNLGTLVKDGTGSVNFRIKVK